MLWSTLAPHLYLSFLHHKSVDTNDWGIRMAFRSSDHVAAFQSKTWTCEPENFGASQTGPLQVAKWLCPVKLHACVRLQQSVCVWLTLHSKSTSSHLPKPWWLEGSASMTALVSCWRLQFNFDTYMWHISDMFDARCPTLQPFIWLRTWRFIKSTPQTPLVSSTLDESQQGLMSTQISRWAKPWASSPGWSTSSQRRSTGSCPRPLDLFQSVREPLPVLCTPWPKPRSVETHPYCFHIRGVGSVQSRQP